MTNTPDEPTPENPIVLPDDETEVDDEGKPIKHDHPGQGQGREDAPGQEKKAEPR